MLPPGFEGFPPISTLATQLRGGEISSEQIVSICLERIDRNDDRIRAWVQVFRDTAKADARLRDQELRDGRDRGPLHGMPVGIKDIIDVAGSRTGCGAPSATSRPVVEADAGVVRRLREAGAVILGKTVTTAYASFDPPPTANPWNAERTPGGSSSGSAAAAVAAGMCVAAIGTQTGGSICRPASYCGVAGLKPTKGAVPLAGVLPLAEWLDHVGPIARHVEDLFLMYEAIHEYDEDDPGAFPRSRAGIFASPSATVNSGRGFSPRLGRLRGSIDRKADATVRSAVETAVEQWRDAGATIEDIEPVAEFDDIWERHHCLMAVGAATVHGRRQQACPEDYPPCISRLIESGREMSATQFAAALAFQRMIRRTQAVRFHNFDGIISPATTTVAPDRSTTGSPDCNSPWSLLGFPSVSFPVGISADDMPVAVQLSGLPWSEARLRQTGRWCESRLMTGVAGSDSPANP